MKNKIKKEVLEWYENMGNHDNESIESFVDLVIDKTTEVLFEEIKKQLKNEFLSGNLKHDFIISPDYYLELKLKEVKQFFSKSNDSPPPNDSK
jgi:hypothetical protein